MDLCCLAVRSLHPAPIILFCGLRLTQECPRLQHHTSGVDVLYQLPEHVGLELLNDQGLVLVKGRLKYTKQ